MYNSPVSILAIKLFTAASIWLVAMPASAQEASRANWESDFEFAISAIEKRYAYKVDLKIDWAKLRPKYKQMLDELESNSERFLLLEQLLDELHDHHAHLNQNHMDSFRLVPRLACIWVDFQNGAYEITDVRAGTEAAKSGLRPGMIVMEVNDQSIDEAVEIRLRPFEDQDSSFAKSWAARTLIAGKHSQKQLKLAVKEDGILKQFEFAIGDTPEIRKLLIHKTLADGIEYVRVENTLGSLDLVGLFDQVIDSLDNNSSLILDLRNTPTGGITAVARGIMGRLISNEMPYQRHEFNESRLNIKRVWVEYVEPRGPSQFRGNLVVLCGRWTGSMGEGIVIGLDAMDRATIVGSKMAGLKGATTRFDFPNSKFGLSLPVERMFHIDGTPREKFVPCVLVDDSIRGPEDDDDFDPYLEAAVRLIKERRDALETVKLSLEAILDRDQEIRHQFEPVEKQHGRESKEFKLLVSKCNQVDAENLKVVAEILDQYGWLGAEEIGQKANTSLFLVVQHADDDREAQAKYLPMLRLAVANKKASPVHLAMLEDRIAIAKSQPQEYGSQLALDEKTGSYVVSPVRDVSSLDKRRAAIGLPLMADYLKHWNLDWEAERIRLAKEEAERTSD